MADKPLSNRKVLPCPFCGMRDDLTIHHYEDPGRPLAVRHAWRYAL